MTDSHPEVAVSPRDPQPPVPTSGDEAVPASGEAAPAGRDGTLTTCSDGTADPFADTGYREAVVDLLGALAYGELTGFGRMVADAELAPSLEERARLSRLAVVEFTHFELLHTRLTALGVDPQAAMEPFVKAVDGFHERTAPETWLERLVKAYVGDGIAMDFYREISAFLDPDTRTLVTEVLSDAGQSEFVVNAVRAAVAADPSVGGRLALWGRRLVGEALSQGQRVAADRDALASLVVGSVDRPTAGLVELVALFGRITASHARRMATLGFTP